MRPTPIPGLYVQLEGEAKWAGSDIKRRHFLIEGQTLKLFGRRGKTHKGSVNLLAVTALKPTTDATAPPGALELHVRSSRTREQTCILVPDHSADDLFMGLGNAVPSHATSDDLWQRHMSSRPAACVENPRQYRMGKTLGTGTFGKVKLAQRSDGELFALKCLNRSRIVHASQGGRLAKEIRLLKMLNHPNVIRLHEVLHTPAEILMVRIRPGTPLALTPSHPARPTVCGRSSWRFASRPLSPRLTPPGALAPSRSPPRPPRIPRTLSPLVLPSRRSWSSSRGAICSRSSTHSHASGKIMCVTSSIRSARASHSA